MKVLMINGSPHAKGNTALALEQMADVFHQEGVETQMIQVGHLDVRGCMACGACRNLGKCVFDDVVNTLADALRDADGLVVASPVYYASANATLVAALDRLFYSKSFDTRMKVGASVAVARRGGCSATFDHLRYARCLQHLLEQCPRQNPRRSRPGCRGHRHRPEPGQKHDLPDEVHRPGKRSLRPPRPRTQSHDQFHPLRDYPWNVLW